MHSASCNRRTLLRTGLAAAVGAALGACGTAPPPTSTPPAATSRLRLIGEARLASKMQFQGTTVGGLSGLDFDPARNLWVALSDDRSELQPARFYTLRIDVRPQSLAVAVTDVITLRDAGGRPYPPRRNGGEVVDPEGIRLLPGGGVLWSSEGESRVNQHPAMHESRLDGTHVRSFEMPALLQFPQRPGTGPRDNQGLEGLALTPDGRTAWVAMEGALLQDGPLPTVGAAGGPCRFTAFDVGTGRALRQIAYVPEAIPLAPKIPGTYADNGVSEILMLDAHRMLVLERAYALGTGNALRLFEIDTRAASDTLQQGKLAPAQFRPAAKKMVADFATLGLPLLDNTEGMCWGPARPGGGRTLVVVSDDNFNASQVTQFAAFDYLE